MAYNYQKIAQVLALAALLGSIPFGYIALYLKSPKAAKEVGRDVCCADILGKGGAFAVALLSILKGYIAVRLSSASIAPVWVVTAAVITALSASFPYWLMFKRSRAAWLTYFGAALALLHLWR